MVAFFGFKITKVSKKPVQTSSNGESAAPAAAAAALPSEPVFFSFNIRHNTNIIVILSSHV
jgi:hypothetical protein